MLALLPESSSFPERRFREKTTTLLLSSDQEKKFHESTMHRHQQKTSYWQEQERRYTVITNITNNPPQPICTQSSILVRYQEPISRWMDAKIPRVLPWTERGNWQPPAVKDVVWNKTKYTELFSGSYNSGRFGKTNFSTRLCGTEASFYNWNSTPLSQPQQILRLLVTISSHPEKKTEKRKHTQLFRCLQCR